MWDKLCFRDYIQVAKHVGTIVILSSVVPLVYDLLQCFLQNVVPFIPSHF